MPDYAIYGGRLSSELEFPELAPAAPGAPDWSVRVSAAPGDPPLDLLGELPLEGGITARLQRTAAGFSLSFEDTGRFDIRADGGEIVWRPATNADESAARLDILGRGLAVALHCRGGFCLHASSVVIGGRAVAFLAQSGTGKSTLAYALVRAGAQLLADDALPLDPGPPVMAQPGAQHVRLNDDSARATEAPSEYVVGPRGKRELRGFEPGQVATGAAPLAALYLLAPVAADADAPIARERVTPWIATTALLAQGRLGPLLGGAEAAVALRRAGAVASAVPVYVLRVARDLDRLAAAAQGVWSWHAD